MSTVLISDIHLGSSGGIDLLRRPEFRELLWPTIEDADEVVLLGDVVELRDMPLAAALEIARPFFDELGAAIGKGRVVIVPGNHDHHLLDDWLEPRPVWVPGQLPPNLVVLVVISPWPPDRRETKRHGTGSGEASSSLSRRERARVRGLRRAGSGDPSTTSSSA